MYPFIMKPNLFVVGAAKSGTSTLHAILNTHPDIYMSPIKEPHFFSKDINPGRFYGNFRNANNFDAEDYFGNDLLMPLHAAFIRDEKQYLALFRETTGQKYRGEASPSYLFSKMAPQEIVSFCKDAKIIIILRDPVERIISHYQMDVMDGMQKEINIYEGVMQDYKQKEKGWGISHLYVELSQYKDQVQQYLKLFGPSNVLLLDFDLLKSNPEKLFEKISIFLEIPDNFDLEDLQKNETIVPKTKLVKNLIRIWQHIKFFEVGSRLKKILFKRFFSKPGIVIAEDFYVQMHQLLKDEIIYYRSLFKSVES